MNGDATQAELLDIFERMTVVEWMMFLGQGGIPPRHLSMRARKRVAKARRKMERERHD